jgi:transposase
VEPGPVKEPRESRTVRRFTLSEKIAIVRESLVPGVAASFVARQHGIAVNLLYYWRKAYRDVVEADLTAMQADAKDSREIADLKLQVRNLERLLGQRTLEIALLRERLGKRDEGDV